MKRLVTIITIFFCIYSVFAITWGKKDELDIFGDKTGNSIIYTVDEQEGWFSDATHAHEPITWTAQIDEYGYISFDIFENGIPTDLSVPSPYLISLKSNDALSLKEYDAYLIKSDNYCKNRITSYYFYIDKINFSEPMRIVIYNEDGIYNLGPVDFSEVESLYYDMQSYNIALSLIAEGKHEEAKEIIVGLDYKTYVHYNCKALVNDLDSVLYLDAAEIKYEEGDYYAAKNLLDELSFINNTLYKSWRAVNLSNKVDIKFGLESISKGQISQGCKALSNVEYIDDSLEYGISIDYEVVKALTTYLSSLSSRNEIDKAINDFKDYEPQSDSFWSSLLILYANTLENKGLINTPSQTPVDFILELFKEKQSDIDDSNKKILQNALYLSLVIQEANSGNYKEAFNQINTYLLLPSATKDNIKDTIEELLKEYCESLEKAMSTVGSSTLSICNISSFYSLCNDFSYYKDAVYLEAKYQIAQGAPYYTKQYFVEDKEIKATLTNNGMSFSDDNGLGYYEMRGNIISKTIEEIQKLGFQDLERVFIPDEIKVKAEKIDIEVFNSIWEHMINELLPSELEIDYPIVTNSDAYQEDSLRTRSIETINGRIIGSQYKDELVFIVNKPIFKILSNGKLDMLYQIEYTIQETEDSVIIHLPDTYLFDDIFCYLEELVSKERDLAFVFRGDGILARSNFYDNYAVITTNMEDQIIDEIIELNKDQFGDYYFDKKSSDVFIYYPSFLSNEDVEMLLQEIRDVLQNYFTEDTEEINELIIQPVELTESIVSASTSTQNKLQTVPASKVDSSKEKNKYNDIRGTFGIEVYSTLNPISEELFITGSYTDKYKRNHYKEGYATDKLIISMPVGISYPITNNLFIGYKCGISVYSYSFTDNNAKYSATNGGLSNRFEIGSYISNSMFSIKTFLSYTFVFDPTWFNDYSIGVSFCIPYFEVGLALDRFRTPSFFFSFKFI